MNTYKLTIEYDGTRYHGWQKQNDVPTIQDRLEQCLYRLTQHHINIYGGGRTDAGVHARGQVAHITCPKDWDPFKLKEGLNAHLRHTDIAILDVERVPPTFHARFSALYREYSYTIIVRRSPLTLDRLSAHRISYPLDVTRMNEAAQHFVGVHDFTAFRSSQCQAHNPVRTITEFAIHNSVHGGLTRIIFNVCAPSFLHHQVRKMIASLVMVGSRKHPPEWISTLLKNRDPHAIGGMMSPQGLVLERIGYAL